MTRWKADVEWGVARLVTAIVLCIGVLAFAMLMAMSHYGR